MCSAFFWFQYVNLDTGDQRPHSAPGTNIISMAFVDAMGERPKSTQSAGAVSRSGSCESLQLSQLSTLDPSHNDPRLNLSSLIDTASGPPSREPTPTPSQQCQQEDAAFHWLSNQRHFSVPPPLARRSCVSLQSLPKALFSATISCLFIHSDIIWCNKMKLFFNQCNLSVFSQYSSLKLWCNFLRKN